MFPDSSIGHQAAPEPGHPDYFFKILTYCQRFQSHADGFEICIADIFATKPQATKHSLPLH